MQSRHASVWLALGVTLAVALLHCARAFAPGTVFLSTDVLYSAPPFAAHRAAGASEHNPYLSDQATIYYPWLRYARERLWRGDFPLWTAESYGGVPFFGNLSTGLLFPLNWVHFLLPFHASFTIVPVLKIWLAGFFMFLFLRRLKRSTGAALIGAVAFAIGGFQILWLQYALTHVACSMPLVFYLGERWHQSRRRRDGLWLALALALQFLAGHPESSLVLSASLVLYLVLRESSVRDALAQVARVSAIGLVALGLCCVQLWPFVEYLVRSEGQRLREGHHPFTGSMAQTLSAGGLVALGGALLALLLARRLGREPGRWRALFAGAAAGGALVLLAKAGLGSQGLVQLLPNLYGNPLDGGAYRGPHTYTEMNGGFVSVTALLLALVAVVRGGGAVRPLAAVAIVAFGTAHHWPGLYHVMRSLPLFQLLAGTRILLAVAFAVAALAAYGADAIGALDWRRPRAWCAAGGFALATLAGGATLLGTHAAATSAATLIAPVAGSTLSGREPITFDIAPPAGARQLTLRVDGGIIRQMPVAAERVSVPWIGSERLEEGPYEIALEFRGDGGTVLAAETTSIRIERAKSAGAGDLAFLLLALVAVVVASALAAREHLGLAHGFLLAVVAAELFRFGFFYNAVTPEAQVFPATQTTTFLADRVAHEPPLRILTEETILQPNLHLPYFLPHVRGYDAMENRAYMAVMRHLFREQEVPWTKWSADTIAYEQPLFDLFGVRYILSTHDLSRFAKLKPVLTADGLTIYENTSAMPRAFIVGETADVASPESVHLDPRTRGFLERPLHLSGTGTARVTHYESDWMEVEVDVQGSALLIVTDNDFPGWKAFVDGVERPVLRTHGTFRAVAVSQGDRLIKFVYRPLSVIGGAVISGLTLLLVLAGLLGFRERRAS